MTNSEKPLVYACSGCSNVAQMANNVAVALDRAGDAEMSCISGVGGGVRKLVNLAKSGRRIIALDGCPLHCVSCCLKNVGVKPDIHLTLSNLGYKKKYGEDFGADICEQVANEIRELAIFNPPSCS
jgi:uncharacterized metal-binding protein